jgi:hypothetical protein
MSKGVDNVARESVAKKKGGAGAPPFCERNQNVTSKVTYMSCAFLTGGSSWVPDGS